jgi:hypothetical protein
MATLEELTVIATQEIENAKPLFGQDANGVKEFTEAEYEQAIIDLANFKFDEQQNGYKRAREQAYLPIAEQLDMQYWDSVNGTTNWKDHIAQVKADNPKPE